MNEELKIEIINLLKDGKSFVLEQTPEIVQQFYTWELTSSWVWLIIGLCMVSLIKGAISNLRLIRTDNLTYSEEYALTIYVGMYGGLFFIGALIFLINLMDLMQLYIAPKVYLLEHLIKLYGE